MFVKHLFGKKQSIIAIIIFMLLIAFVLVEYIPYVQNVASEQSGDILEGARVQLCEMISTEMNSEREHIETGANLIRSLILKGKDSESELIDTMHILSPTAQYSHWEVCFPDGHAIKEDGTEIQIGEEEFRHRINKEFVVSEPMASKSYPNENVLLLSKCIFEGDECIGILSSVINLPKLADYFKVDLYNGTAEVLLFERGTGKLLFCTRDRNLENLSDISSRTLESDDTDDVAKDISQGGSGMMSFVGKTSGEVRYVSYSAVDFEDWTLLVTAPESECMSASCRINLATTHMLLALAAIFVLYMIYVIHGERRIHMALEKRQKRIEKALSAAEEANSVKTDFLFNISHDIRTPMNAIVGYSNLIESHWEDEKLAKTYLTKLKDSSEFMKSIVDKVLEMSKIEGGDTALKEVAWNVVAFSEKFTSVFEQAMRDKNIRFTKTMNIHHNAVYCDEIKLREVFFHLLDNAIKYTPEGGSISLTVTELPSDKPGYALFKSTIEDNGKGISEEFLPHLFEEFSREHNSTQSNVHGTGLGLAIVKSHIDLMGGTIEVESVENEGTKVTVCVPHRLIEQANVVLDPGAERSIDAEQFKNKRLLLAEDNELNAEIAMMLLEDNGFAVDVAKDGEVCVQMMKDAPEGYYDAILMDIQMPKLNGYEATRVIRQMEGRKCEIPIIAVTANAFDEDRKNAFDAGMNAHIAKPIIIPKLMLILSEVLGEKID